MCSSHTALLLCAGTIFCLQLNIAFSTIGLVEMFIKKVGFAKKQLVGVQEFMVRI